MKRLFIIVILLVSYLWGVAQETYTYAKHDTIDLKLDVYRPATPRQDKTCVIYVFGGGFYSGSRDDKSSKLACKALTDQGFTAISIDYRLGLRLKNVKDYRLTKAYLLFYDVINMAVEDCCEAIQYVWNHAEELDIDRNKIVLTGSSAGAITVLQTDYARANSLDLASSLPKEFKPLAVIPYAGAINLIKGKVSYTTPPAPTCFFHGTYDKIVNYKKFHGSLRASLNGANTLAKIFKKNGYSYWIMRFDKRGHEVAVYLPYTVQEFTAFVDGTLAGRKFNYDCHCEDKALKATKHSRDNIFDLYFR